MAGIQMQVGLANALHYFLEPMVKHPKDGPVLLAAGTLVTLTLCAGLWRLSRQQATSDPALPPDISPPCAAAKPATVGFIHGLGVASMVAILCRLAIQWSPSLALSASLLLAISACRAKGRPVQTAGNLGKLVIYFVLTLAALTTLFSLPGVR